MARYPQHNGVKIFIISIFYGFLYIYVTYNSYADNTIIIILTDLSVTCYYGVILFLPPIWNTQTKKITKEINKYKKRLQQHYTT